MNTDGIDLGPVSPAPAPQPVTPPAPAPKQGSAGAAGWLVSLALAGVLLWPYLPAMPSLWSAPVPATPLAKAAGAYRDGLGPAFKAVAGKVRSGELKTADAVAAEFGKGSRPLADACRQAVKANADDKGVITAPAAVADEFDHAAAFLGVK